MFRLSRLRIRARSRCVFVSLTARTVVKRVLTALLILSASIPAFSTTFPGTNTGPILDGGGGTTPQCTAAPRDINFAVSGMSGSLASVSLDFTMNPQHTYVGDLQVSLIAPDATTFVIFSRVGQNAATGDFGDSSDLNGTYSFADIASNNFWTAANTANGTTGPAGDILTGSYRTQLSGQHPNDTPGPAFTTLNTAFSGIATPNGNWTLRFLDCAAADTGTVSAANLTLLVPSASNASVSGRVTTAGGSGIRNAIVNIQGGDLTEPIIARTAAFGYYDFSVPAGQTYVIFITSKRFTFAEPVRVLNVGEDITDVDFIALE